MKGAVMIISRVFRIVCAAAFISLLVPLRSSAQTDASEDQAKIKVGYLRCEISSGWSYLQEYIPRVAQACVRAGWFDAVGLGRLALSYPEYPADVLAGRRLDRRRICRTFSDCTTAPRNGLVSGCYPLDPFYRNRPERAELERIKRGGR